MAYTDGTHLVADSLVKLHQFAASIGLRRKWFQDHPRHPHYDLTTTRMARKALRYGANKVSSRALVEISLRLKTSLQVIVDVSNLKE